MVSNSSCKLPRRLLLAVLLCLPSLLAQSNGYLSVGEVPKVAGKRGAAVQVKIPLAVQPGYHVNSNKPSEDYLIPLKLTWASTGVLEGGEAELEHAQHRFTREFRALRAVLREAGFLDGDAPTALGLLAEGLYGESALIVANAIAAGTLEGLRPEELAGTLVMLVAEDRGRDRPPASRRRFPTARVEHCHRELRSALRSLEAVEAEHGLHTLAPLSLDYVIPAYRWGLGEDLTDIEPPAGADVGDVVKAVKSLYSLLRQMEQALRGHALHQVVQTTRERIERDLIRRV